MFRFILLALAAPALTHALSLDEAIVIALEKNQTIRVQSFDRGITSANLLAAKGAFDPALNLRRLYAEDGAPASSDPLVRQLLKTDDYAASIDGLTPWGMTYSLGVTGQNLRHSTSLFRDRYATFGGVTVTQPLLRGFGLAANLAGVRLAKNDRSLAQWEYRQVVIDTVTAVIVAYNDLGEAIANQQITRRYRNEVIRLLEENQKRYEVGSIADADVKQARARVADLEESVIYADRAVADAENRLRRLLGETHFEKNPAPIGVAILPPALHPEVDLEATLPKALADRPDMEAARLGVSRSRILHASSRNALLPRVDLVGSYGYNGLSSDFQESRRQVRNEENRSLSVGVVINVPLTFAEGRGRVRAARLAVQQREEDLSRVEADAVLGITQAAAQIDATKARVEVLDGALELARASLEAEIRRLAAGTGNTFVVLQKHAELASVESRQARALADQRRALAYFERETATTLESHRITLE